VQDEQTNDIEDELTQIDTGRHSTSGTFDTLRNLLSTNNSVKKGKVKGTHLRSVHFNPENFQQKNPQRMCSHQLQ